MNEMPRNNTGGNIRRSNTGGQTGNVIPKGYNYGQLENYTPQQMELHQRGFNQVAPDSYLSKLAAGDQGIFDEIEAPAHRQFSEKLGQIGSRFSGMGTGGRHSSGFQNESTAAASNFAQDLQSRRHELQRQAVQDLFGMSNDLLGQKPYERGLFEKPQKKQSGLGGWGSVGGTALGAAAGYFAGDPISGAKIGNAVGSGFD